LLILYIVFLGGNNKYHYKKCAVYFYYLYESYLLTLSCIYYDYTHTHTHTTHARMRARTRARGRYPMSLRKELLPEVILC